MTQIVLPNVRKCFIPDPGHVMFDADLKGADAQVVAWEADDDDLKNAFRAGIDIHVHNAEALWGTEFTKLPEGSHARDARRQDCKKGVHLTNYGGTARTCAISMGWTTAEAERFQHRWLSIHPKIRGWHDRIRDQLARDRTIHNAFGFRRVFFDRIDDCFAEALAWIPQSTVAINSYIGALQLEGTYFPDPLSTEGILLQTHDSITFQFETQNAPKPGAIKAALEVKTPYPDPLYIPWDLKMSEKSWGDLRKIQ